LRSANVSFASAPGISGSLWRMRKPLAEICRIVNFTSSTIPSIWRRGT
jgi:hypothetical protein